jgi:hypothetical protein
MRLSAQAVENIRKEFHENGNGLDVMQFVDVVGR